MILVLLFTFLLIIAEGQKCGTSYRDDGICRKVTECSLALNTLSKKRMHGLNRCGFDGSVEIVCCPISEVREFPDEDTSLDITKSPSSNIWGGGQEITTRKSTRTSTTSRDILEVKQQNSRRKSEIGKIILYTLFHCFFFHFFHIVYCSLRAVF